MKIHQAKTIFYFILATITCLLLFELLLHYYNPSRSRVRNGKILLPSNQSYVFNNFEIPKIGKHIVHTKNSLGFRGPEIPADFNNYISIVALGGSTTECYYLSDNETWPFLVGEHLKKSHGQVWLNNGGLDGFSTFGISILFDEYISKIKPKYALLLLGSNEIGRSTPSGHDTSKMNTAIKSTSVLQWVKKESEILDFVKILKNKIKIQLSGATRNIGHKPLYLEKIPHVRTDNQVTESLLNLHRTQYIPNYKSRISSIILMCRKNGVIPVFITQPTLVGNGIDKTTNVNLETISFDNKHNGFTQWKLMELYNDVLRECSIKEKIYLIDLALVFPKDSRYFYDNEHFGIEGAKLAATLIGNSLDDIIPETGK